MAERPVRFRLGGLIGQISEVEWPKHLPLPPPGLTAIRMPNHEHRGIAVDKNNDIYSCLQGQKGYEWNLV